MFGGNWMKHYLIEDTRLGIPVVRISEKEWDDLSFENKQQLLYEWELIRAKIPGRIHEVEAMIIVRQDALSLEDNFETACRLNREIYELASIINDLHLWYRANQEISEKQLHG
jgi:hypothetical protein